MDKFKQFLENIRRNMPKHTQWVLAAIALLIVVMLILLLTDKDRSSGAVVKKTTSELTLSIAPNPVNFGEIEVGTSKEIKISVLANEPTVISGVSLATAVSGLSLRHTCETMGQITDKLPCEITLMWKPKEAISNGKNVINIKYYAASGQKDMEKLESVNVSFVAKLPIPEVVEEELPELPELELEEDTVAEVLAPKPVQKKAEDVSSEACYEYSFAGYNNSGKQIGWIKPNGGHYMFHPFSDKNCSNPTGEYNPDTGFITSLDDSAKKIGSDAEHIGGRGAGIDLVMPTLSNPTPQKAINRAMQLDIPPVQAEGPSKKVLFAPTPESLQLPTSFGKQATVSTRPYDRTFVLRHFKPIPATIVNEIRAVKNSSVLPVMATVDRHVYSDNGRTIIVPAGTLMLGNVVGDMPGPYKTIGRINIEWYRFVRPDGVEFNFSTEDKPFSGDSQGRIGVPGYGSSDYFEQMVMPLLTAIVPAATNLIAPISDKIVNQIDLDNNVVVQTGTMRSSELAKQEMIKSWNKVTEKLFIDMLDNTKPPFSIASGTRITVYSPTDLIVAWCNGDKCTPTEPANGDTYAPATKQIYNETYTIGKEDPESMIGQVSAYISGTGSQIQDARLKQLMEGFKQYQSKSGAANEEYKKQLDTAGGVMKSDGTVLKKGTTEYNKEVLGIQYKKVTDSEGNVKEIMIDPTGSSTGAGKPAAPSAEVATEDAGLTCDSGTPPDNDGCCPGETFTDMGDAGWNCCPDAGGDCFPPIK